MTASILLRRFLTSNYSLGLWLVGLAFQGFYKRVRELMPSDYRWLTLLHVMWQVCIVVALLNILNYIALALGLLRSVHFNCAWVENSGFCLCTTKTCTMGKAWNWGYPPPQSRRYISMYARVSWFTWGRSDLYSSKCSTKWRESVLTLILTHTLHLLQTQYTQFVHTCMYNSYVERDMRHVHIWRRANKLNKAIERSLAHHEPGLCMQIMPRVKVLVRLYRYVASHWVRWLCYSPASPGALWLEA